MNLIIRKILGDEYLTLIDFEGCVNIGDDVHVDWISNEDGNFTVTTDIVYPVANNDGDVWLGSTERIIKTVQGLN